MIPVENFQLVLRGVENDFLAWKLNRTTERDAFACFFRIDKSYYASEIVDMMMESDPVGFAKLVLMFLQERLEQDKIKYQKDGDDVVAGDRDGTD